MVEQLWKARGRGGASVAELCLDVSPIVDLVFSTAVAPLLLADTSG